MQMSKNGRKLLAEWEGFETAAYKDSAGLDTIGVGHLITKTESGSGEIEINGEPIKYADGLTEAQVYALLGQDLQRFDKAVSESVKTPLNQNQFDALVSFSFNVGVWNFKSSTLLKKLNEGDYVEVPNQLRRWNKAGGKVVQGLVNRREKEINLWES
ncbi:MAG: lysozyme [Candidatus Polarisedimenticolaceae bacterium]|nr:lysozyme [Candidatus Polarisedimenticolaceae bacterium]